MSVDYNTFAKQFAESRKNMKWEEIEYFFKILWKNTDDILDIGCGSGRLLEAYHNYFGSFPEKYIWIDLSSGLLEEARKTYPNYDFLEKNMLEIQTVEAKNIFLIASFHHLGTIEEREEMMCILYDSLRQWGKICMTNWALDSQYNEKKYRQSRIENSENEFGWSDYTIKFWDTPRYYHCFSLKELEYLAKKTGFTIVENRLFDSEKNYITILEK